MNNKKFEFTQVTKAIGAIGAIAASLLLGGLILACATSREEIALPATAEVPGGTAETVSDSPAVAQPAGIADRDIGLSKASVFDVPVPGPVLPNVTDPGEQDLLPRPYEIWPPRIPHLVADYLPITLSENLCVDCHHVESAEEGDPKPIPATHFVDLRNAPEEMQATVAGARYVCTACHVEQTEAQPLVENLFAAAAK